MSATPPRQTPEHTDRLDRAVWWTAVVGAVALVVFAVYGSLTFDWPSTSPGGDAGDGAVTAPDGSQLVETFGCTACHSTDGTETVGPTWQGIAGAERSMEDGATVVADRSYLTESITEPGARIVAGYTDTMPADYADRMTAEDIDAVVTYLETLSQ